MLSEVADVVRTAFKCATVAILGYLGFTLVQQRVLNPPAHVVRLESDELTDLRRQVASVEEELGTVRASCREARRAKGDAKSLRKALEKHRVAQSAAVSKLQREIKKSRALPAHTAMEYGTVLFRRPADYKWKNCQRIRFKNEYNSPPLIFTNQWQTAGYWVAAQAQQVTMKDAQMCVSIAEQNRNYQCQIAYIVIGQAAE